MSSDHQSRKQSTATLEEIARKAGVSTATVSYALNGKGRISTRRRRQIVNLLREEGYQPRSPGRSVLLLLSVDELTQVHGMLPFRAKLLGLSERLHESYTHLDVELVGAEVDFEAHMERIVASRFRGAILDSSLKDSCGSVASRLQANDIPIVQMGFVPWAQGFESVCIDDFQGGYEAGRYFAACGHRRIATIRWNVEGDPPSARKFAGFGCALQEAGIPLPAEYVVEAPLKGEVSMRPGREAMNRLLALPEPPTAAFVENSFVSPPLLYAIGSEAGLPQAIRDIDMIHFEAVHMDSVEQVISGTLMISRRNTKLLRIDWQEMGRVAADRVIALSSDFGRENPPQTIRLAPHLVHLRGMDEVPLTAP